MDGSKKEMAATPLRKKRRENLLHKQAGALFEPYGMRPHPENLDLVFNTSRFLLASHGLFGHRRTFAAKP